MRSVFINHQSSSFESDAIHNIRKTDILLCYTFKGGFWVSQFKAFFNLMQLSYLYCHLSMAHFAEVPFNPKTLQRHISGHAAHVLHTHRDQQQWRTHWDHKVWLLGAVAEAKRVLQTDSRSFGLRVTCNIWELLCSQLLKLSQEDSHQ